MFGLSQSKEKKLFKAFEARDFLKCVKLIEAGADLSATNDCQDTILHLLANDLIPTSVEKYLKKESKFPAYPDMYFADYLLYKGANANACNLKGETPLKKSISSKWMYECFSPALIKATDKQHLSMVYPDGETILTQIINSCALRYPMDINIQTICAAGANVNVANKDGLTPIFCLLDNRSDSGVIRNHLKLLLQYGADIHAKDLNNNTLLHVATERGDALIVYTLLSHGAASDINAVNNNGETPLDLANEPIRFILKSYQEKEMRKQPEESIMTDFNILTDEQKATVATKMIKQHPILFQKIQNSQNQKD